MIKHYKISVPIVAALFFYLEVEQSRQFIFVDGIFWILSMCFFFSIVIHLFLYAMVLLREYLHKNPVDPK